MGLALLCLHPWCKAPKHEPDTCWQHMMVAVLCASKKHLTPEACGAGTLVSLHLTAVLWEALVEGYSRNLPVSCEALL